MFPFAIRLISPAIKLTKKLHESRKVEQVFSLCKIFFKHITSGRRAVSNSPKTGENGREREKGEEMNEWHNKLRKG